MNLFADSHLVLLFVASILAFGILLETLTMIRVSSWYEPNGFLDSAVVMTHWRIEIIKTVFKPFQFLLVAPIAQYLVYARALSSLAVLFYAGFGSLETWPIVVLFVINLLLAYRDFDPSGGDCMRSILVGALLWNQIGGGSPLMDHYTVIFIGIQSCLAYFFNSYAKLKTKNWRSGEALSIAVSSSFFCDRLRPMALSNRSLLKYSSWFVLIWELSFPLVLFTGPIGLLFFLLMGLAFHGAIVLVMGLPQFFWMFVATYPAIIYLNYEFS